MKTTFTKWIAPAALFGALLVPIAVHADPWDHGDHHRLAPVIERTRYQDWRFRHSDYDRWHDNHDRRFDDRRRWRDDHDRWHDDHDRQHDDHH